MHDVIFPAPHAGKADEALPRFGSSDCRDLRPHQMIGQPQSRDRHRGDRHRTLKKKGRNRRSQKVENAQDDKQRDEAPGTTLEDRQ